ncbi:MAG TPA: hypothetical protein DF783_02040 [Acidimicrobiaceae bacterium]|nr:hypothetical protein [Acidimicrobiaceae bacterium]HJO79914.1 hypothetical protein [Acidimicrobiales bacterium]
MSQMTGGRLTPGRVFLGLLVLAMASMWFYAFFLARSGNPDRLDDGFWAEAAEARCVEMLEDIAAIAPASSVTNPASRAADLDEATVVLSAMVTDLRALEPGTHEDAFLIGNWLADWDTYLSDRRVHAERLRTEGDVRPLMSTLPGGAGSIQERMNGFARVNDMDSCLDPGDL